MDRHVAIDVETVAPYSHIIEIAGVEIVGGRLTGKHYLRRVKPDTRTVNPHCVKVHGITLADVAHEPGFGSVLPELADFVGGATILSHNVAAERNSIAFECSRLGVRNPFPDDRYLCTMRLARSASYQGKLREMCSAAGLGIGTLPREHDALSDAKMAALLFLKLTGR
jgi:DNA polymerase-3 subunit epsilon